MPRQGSRRESSRFLDHMADAMRDADVVVSRAGATTLAEIAAVGRAALLVPLPGAADGHQRLNADVLVRAGAADVGAAGRS